MDEWKRGLSSPYFAFVLKYIYKDIIVQFYTGQSKFHAIFSKLPNLLSKGSFTDEPNLNEKTRA